MRIKLPREGLSVRKNSTKYDKGIKGIERMKASLKAVESWRESTRLR